MRLTPTCFAFVAAALLAAPASAYEGPVDKQRLSLPAFTFQDGRTLPLTVGYETYGTLNAEASNAVLICHFFGGTSHAAGKYAKDDPRPGYWDALIGAKAAIDTDRHFVVAVDVPANVNVTDPRMVTTGPHSRDPQTQQPYGPRFPAVSIRDMVETQRALADRLGIRRWHAVVGASLGGMQAMQWAVSHPERVARVVTVAAPGRSEPYNQAMAQVMIDAIQSDGHFRGGDYYGHPAPTRGLKAAWKLLYAQGLHRDHMARPGTPFLSDLETQAAARLPRLDANAWVRLSEASRDFDVAHGHADYPAALRRVQAKVLVVAAEGDMLFPPERLERELAAPLRLAGKRVDFRLLPTTQGHLGSVFDLNREGPAINRFLAEP
jgi:homoserine O-acetyltransferase